MTRVVLAAHGGHSSTGAARIAPLVAERLDAELDIVSVLPAPAPMDYGFGLVYVASPETDSELTQALAAQMHAQLAQCGVVGRAPVIRHGQAAIEIAAAARASDAALIVVGLGPHGALDRALGDETALQLVQLASTPVLAVPENATKLPRHVVVAIDFTPSSLLAAQTAARLLARGSALHLVHVRAPARQANANNARAAVQRTDAEVKLADVASNLPIPYSVTIKHAVLDGEPARALLGELARVKGDLIALGSHGYGLWKRLTIGSVASKILRLARTSVLVQPIASVTSAALAPSQGAGG